MNQDWFWNWRDPGPARMIVRACSMQFWEDNPGIAGSSRGSIALLLYYAIPIGETFYFQAVHWDDLTQADGDPEQLIREGLIWTMTLMPPRIRRSGEAQIPRGFLPDEFENAWYISTSYRHYGATAIWYPGFADYLSVCLQSDYYFLFSDLQEAIVIPASSCTESDFLQYTHQYFQVKHNADSFLSGAAYVYHGGCRELVEINLPGC